MKDSTQERAVGQEDSLPLIAIGHGHGKGIRLVPGQPVTDGSGADFPILLPRNQIAAMQGAVADAVPPGSAWSSREVG